MCLILFAWQTQPDLPLLVLANRDEYFDRPTQPLHRWPDQPIYAGKDLSAGGTWLGVTATGRWAAVTNFRQPMMHSNAPSRGQLTEHFLHSNLSPQAYLQQLTKNAAVYNGFNLLVGDREQLFYFSNQEGKIRQLSPGIYGVSNSLLDSDWVKVQTGKQQLAHLLENQAEKEAFFTLMQDRTTADRDKLPNTGVGEIAEMMLSPKFIHAPQVNYGTRSSTLVKFNSTNASIEELNFDKSGEQAASTAFQWNFA